MIATGVFSAAILYVTRPNEANGKKKSDDLGWYSDHNRPIPIQYWWRSTEYVNSVILLYTNLIYSWSKLPKIKKILALFLYKYCIKIEIMHDCSMFEAYI